MDRRERHMRIIREFGHNAIQAEVDRRVAIDGFKALTDEAVEKVASDLVSSHRRANARGGLVCPSLGRFAERAAYRLSRRSAR